jgi:tetratricopeptide (TPR) repeat protein
LNLKDAFQLHAQGRLKEAEHAYGEILKQQPGNFQALHLAGVLLLQKGEQARGMELVRRSLKIEPRQPLAHRDLGNALQQAGRLEEALASFDRALALKSDIADLHNNRAVVLTALGRPAEALESYSRAVALKPDYAQAYNNRGALLSSQKRLSEALADFDKAIALQPGYIKAYNNRGGTLADLGRHAEALSAHDRAIALHPEGAESHNRRGQVLLALGRAPDALASFDKAIALEPDLATAHEGRGTALAALGRHEEALQSQERAIALDPGSATAHNNRGSALAALDRLEEALQCHEQALALDPGSATAHNNRGAALALLGRLEESIASFDRAIALKPDFVLAHTNRGKHLGDLNRLDDALASYERAAAIDPDAAEAQFGKSLILLTQGRYAEGWPIYEWRKKRVAEEAFHAQSRPSWTGREDIGGKKIFIEAEQGLGDTIQFCRYAPLVAARGAQVVMTAQENLVELLKTLDPRVRIVPVGQTPTDFDFHAALLSLPLAFGTRIETIPASIPYLWADPALASRFRDRIGSAGFRVGICWQGSYIAGVRSFALASFSDIAHLPGVRLISLQKGAGSEQLETLPPGMTVERLGDDFPRDFSETAAAMESLDLVISCDTSVAHLAGALGRPCWMALRHGADWRWLTERRDTPWYPGMRLFRQPAPGDWAGAFAQIGAELGQLIRTQKKMGES